MSQQLIYTSAPRGLKPGSRGFCTVATTPGMAANLADRLEALSAYRHIFPPGDPRNPVNYSFLTFTLGGRRLYVLSRVADAGLDYTQRTNKIAHHVVLEQNELPPAGPAALLMQPGFMETAWTGEPRTLAPRPVPAIQDPPRKCALWEQVTGDAGWGGYLAEPPDSRPGTPVILVYRHDMPVLALLTEAMALLAPERRWQTTFSAFYTKLPPGLDCQWRCIAEGSAEAQLVDRQRDAVVMRLGELPRTSATLQSASLVETARTGLPSSRNVIPADREALTGEVLLKDDELEAELRLADEPATGITNRSGTSRTGTTEYGVGPPVAPLPPLEKGSSYTIRTASNQDVRLRTQLGLNRRSGQWIWITALAALVIVAWTAVFAINLFREEDLELAKENVANGPAAHEPSRSTTTSPRDTVHSAVSGTKSAESEHSDLIGSGDTQEVKDQIADSGDSQTPQNPAHDASSDVFQGTSESGNAGRHSGDKPAEVNPEPAKNEQTTDYFVKLPVSEAGSVEFPKELSREAIRSAVLKGIVSSEFGVEGHHFRLKKSSEPSRVEIELLVADDPNAIVQPRAIATISFVGAKTLFRWLPGTDPIQNREYLRNCALRGREQGAPFRLFFRTPEIFASVAFQARANAPFDERPTSLTTAAVKWVPPVDRAVQSTPIPPAPNQPSRKKNQIVLNVSLPSGGQGKLYPDTQHSQRQFLTFHDGIIFMCEAAVSGSGVNTQLSLTSQYVGVILQKSWPEIGESQSKVAELTGLKVFKLKPSDLQSRRKNQESAATEIEAFAKKPPKEENELTKQWNDMLARLYQDGRIERDDASVEMKDSKKVIESLRQEVAALDRIEKSWPLINAQIEWEVSIQIDDLRVPLAKSKSYTNVQE